MIEAATLERLQGIDGVAIETGASLASFTTLGIGGPAEAFVRVSTLSGLSELRRVARESGLPTRLLGLGSNVLLPDDGLPGLTLRLVGEFDDYRITAPRVWAGAGVPLARLARRLTEAGLLGLEALAGFPSTVGGAVVMNAGCYGTEIIDLLVEVTAVDERGQVRVLKASDLGAGYRSTRLQGGDLWVTSAVLELKAGEADAAMEKLKELNRRRHASMPGQPNAGSVFSNPEGDYAGRLIEAVGLKGAREGGARISLDHAKVIVNEGGATSADVLALMVLARRQVLEASGVLLEPELILVGNLGEEWRRRTRSAVGEQGVRHPPV